MTGPADTLRFLGANRQVTGSRYLLDRIVNDTVERCGNILIPTFAIDRAQAIMFHLGELVRGGASPA